jgi:malate/lactate dehydrogenase
VVDIVGGTEVGPAAGFRDIVGSILQDRGEVYSVSHPLRLPGLPETVNVGVPTRVGLELGPNIWDRLPPDEQDNVVDAAKAIHANYLTGLDAVGKT